MHFENTLSFARKLDRTDPLRLYRNAFHHPVIKGKKVIYFTGNSLGLQPKIANQFVTDEMKDWSQLGVEGHFHGKRPWMPYHKFFKKSLARLVGAKPSEVVAMNQLTVNLHLMLISFYRPTTARYKIIMEAGAFPSDQYALETHVKVHGLDPDKTIVELKPRPGEVVLRTEDILKTIHQRGSELALVLMGGVQYYTGQFFDIKEITRAAQQEGAMAGFDLAHAIGNVPLKLHQHNVDFAVWCSYKYLNSGPGSVAGAFVHQRHGDDPSIPRLGGWWGHDERTRFQMKKGFRPMTGADGWQVSNFPVLTGAAHLAALSIFDQAGMPALRKKSVQLTGYLYDLLKALDPAGEHLSILTPQEAESRGCQLSLVIRKNGKKVFGTLLRKGVIADWREPDVIRVAPVPLYNSYEDVYRFVEILKVAMHLK